MEKFENTKNYLLLHLGLKGTHEEKEILKRSKTLNALVVNLTPPTDTKNWKFFEAEKKDFVQKIQTYSGGYLDYFNMKLAEINSEERRALGYDINSD